MKLLTKYTRQQAQRDLNPHKPARVAMILWGHKYSQTGLGSMGFWDTLSESNKKLCREIADQIVKALDED